MVVIHNVSKDIPTDITTSTHSSPVVNYPSMKHPLEHAWTLWYYRNSPNVSWTNNQIELNTFHTVEDFWCLYHHTKLPTDIGAGRDYAVFKQGIPPTWEHSANSLGGRWVITITQSRQRTNKLWLDLVLLMIGENFQHNEEICGAVVNIRQMNKISLWTRNVSNIESIRKIGKELKRTLKINWEIKYQKHNSINSLQNI